ncbi:MAG: hypothetical protein WAK17_08565, partial [Candidatus Nitrosopolaris sp.]
MSTKKGSQDNITTKEATTSTPISSPKSFLAEQHQSVNETLDETKNNINRTIEELGRDIPRKTQVINDYQEHTIQILTEIANSYLQSQKEIINSLQSAWTPHIENAYGSLLTIPGMLQCTTFKLNVNLLANVNKRYSTAVTTTIIAISLFSAATLLSLQGN